MTLDFHHPERLCDEDVRCIVSLVADAGLPPQIKKKRTHLLNRLADFIRADTWIWFHSYVPRGSVNPTNLQHQTCGKVNIRQGIVFALRTLGVTGTPPENIKLDELLLGHRPFTRSIGQLVGDAFWRTDPAARRYVRRLGVDDFAYSIVPGVFTDRMRYMTGVAMGRKVGEPFFTPRELKILHIVVNGVGWLHHEGVSSARAAGMANLGKRHESVIPMLIEGASMADIAEAAGIAPQTVKEYASEIYEAFRVKNRAQLQALFARGDHECELSS